MPVLERIAKLRGVTWEWNEDAAAYGKQPGSRDAGVIAQDVEAVFPELVGTSPEGHKFVNYNGLVGVLVEAVKELEAKRAALEQRVAKLENKKPPPKPRAAAATRSRRR
jgi:hypothetical protein